MVVEHLICIVLGCDMVGDGINSLIFKSNPCSTLGGVRTHDL